MEFCPLSTDWGTFAEWLTAVVAAITGVSVWRLGTKANGIATSAHDVAEEERRRAARVLLLHISSDVAHTLSVAKELLADLRSPITASLFLTEEAVRRRIADRRGELHMATVEQLVPRLYVLDIKEGDALARAIGTQRTFGRATHFASCNHVDDVLIGDYKNIVAILERLVKDLEVVQEATQAVSPT